MIHTGHHRRVAALYDIHGNLPALEAVLHELNAVHVDRVIVGGDVYPGPMANECLVRLMALEIPVSFLMGNGDREVLAAREGRVSDTVPAAVRAALAWNAEHLAVEQATAVASWPATVTAEVEGVGEVLFCHATPDSDTTVVTRATPDDLLVTRMQAPDVALVVCGHTHMAFDRRVGTLRVVNAGSIGMPFGLPGAHWALLGPDVQLRHTAYDLEDAARRISVSAYPGAADFGDRHVRHPPTERQMLDAFAAQAGASP
ncbi:MAG: metallophosphoesterase family protein [Acidobacteria bacterium]|nr:metallophosphoesterase family protein [Acidobacteriota bacterium]